MTCSHENALEKGVNKLKKKALAIYRAKQGLQEVSFFNVSKAFSNFLGDFDLQKPTFRRL
jgi:hypothetical protein